MVQRLGKNVSYLKEVNPLVISIHHPFFKALLSEMEGEMKKRANEMLKNGFFLYNQKQHIHASTMHFGPISFDLHPEHDEEKIKLIQQPLLRK